MDRGELVQAMRRLPGRYAGRLPERTLDRVTAAAAAGQWERAVEVLIAALGARAAVVTVEERDELRRVLEAMDLPGAGVEKLAVRPCAGSSTPGSAAAAGSHQPADRLTGALS